MTALLLTPHSTVRSNMLKQIEAGSLHQQQAGGGEHLAGIHLAHELVGCMVVWQPGGLVPSSLDGQGHLLLKHLDRSCLVSLQRQRHPAQGADLVL